MLNIEYFNNNTKRTDRRLETTLESHEGEGAEEGVAEDEKAYAEARDETGTFRGGGRAAATAAAQQFGPSYGR